VSPNVKTVSGGANTLFTAGADGVKSISISGGSFSVIWKDSQGLAQTESVQWGNGVKSADGTTTFTATSAHYGTNSPAAVLVIKADGSYTFTVNAPVAHNDAGEDDKSISIGFTVTDGDDDTATGQLQIVVDDDAPTVKADTPSILLNVDEDRLPTGATDSNKPGEVLGSNSVTASGLAGALTALFSFGADGAHATQAISLKPTTLPVDSGLNSQGGGVLIKVVGNTLTGYVAGTPERVVFELKVNANGSYSFELKDQIDHPTLNGQTGDNTENTLLTNIDLSAYIVAKDGDGDTVTLGTGEFVVSVQDDIPTVTSQTVNISVDQPEVVAPVPGKVANFVLVLDKSGSTDLAEIKEQVEDFLEKLSQSDAQDVRVHIVEFGSNAAPVGTFDLIIGGQIQPIALDNAIDAVAGLRDGGGTNYEAGLQQALRWIEGTPATTLQVNGEDDFDANSLTGDVNNDEAFILTSGTTQIALVSGWTQTGSAISHLVDVDGGVGSGFGVDGAGGVDEDDVEVNEVIRFDFGAFDNFGVAQYTDGNRFSGVPVTSATFDLDDNNSNDATVFSYRIVFVDGQVETGNRSVSTTGDNTVQVVLTGTLANAGKQIAYVEFSTSGSGRGDVDCWFPRRTEPVSRVISIEN
jgi:T1SS-143 domain-containing protein